MSPESKFMTTSATLTSDRGERVYYVYPRLMSFMKDEGIDVKTLAEKAGISENTISKLRSGLYVSDSMRDACATALKALTKNSFNFESEKMAAQVFYNQQAVKAFIGNRPQEEAAKELGIQKYMLQWILAEKKVSEEFHNKYIASKV